MTNPTTPYGVETHNQPISLSSWLAKVALVKADPVEVSTSDANTVIKSTANSANFLGVANEAKAAGYSVGVDEGEYFVGLVGTGGVSLGSFVKTDGSGGFVVATTGNNAVAQAMTAGSALDYVEFKKLPAVKVI